jgi:uncharacterized protein (DUF1800 family)
MKDHQAVTSNAFVRHAITSRVRRHAGFVRSIAVLVVVTAAGATPAIAQKPETAPAPPPVVAAASAAHFLDQATLGPSPVDVADVQVKGPAQWLQEQFGIPESPLTDGFNTNQVRAEVFLNMATGQDQVRQRVTFALSQIFVVSANKVSSGPELTPWMRVLSRNAFGNYRTLLRDVTLNPTMGKFLDMAYNRKATRTTSINENYAREVLQLFSLGTWLLNQDGTLQLRGGQPIPTYSQDTIREYARALTRHHQPAVFLRRDGSAAHQSRHRSEAIAFGVYAPRQPEPERRSRRRDRFDLRASQRAAVHCNAVDSIAGHEQSVAGLHRARRQRVRR